jgi:Domain of Unknown Function (DUF1080)
VTVGAPGFEAESRDLTIKDAGNTPLRIGWREKPVALAPAPPPNRSLRTLEAPPPPSPSAPKGEAAPTEELERIVPKAGTPPKRANPVPAADGFVPLFNGKDLTGWKTHPRQLDGWRVESGVLVGRGPDVSHLYTDRGDFKNFRLRVEVRINDGGDSGLLLRSSFGPHISNNVPTCPAGYEAQIAGIGPHWTGSLFRHGARSDIVVSVREPTTLPNQWFTQEVIAQDNQITALVNGRTVSSYVDPSRWYTRGHIALQIYLPPTVVEFRKIEIKELP